MKVTIVGAGNMGRGIGTLAVAGGHEVEIVDREPAEAQNLADELGGSATALEPGGPFGGEVVVLALYYPGIKDAVREYADQLAGRVVVETSRIP
jgi:predicted dinucleotide-binding enzyme